MMAHTALELHQYFYLVLLGAGEYLGHLLSNVGLAM
jgi:hypothetical protein